MEMPTLVTSEGQLHYSALPLSVRCTKQVRCWPLLLASKTAALIVWHGM